MKYLLPIFVFSTAALTVSAQPPALDNGVASEVARTQMGDTTAQTILANTNLMTQYQNVAVEQELVQESVRRGLTGRLDVQQSIQAARRRILIQALRNDVVKAAPAPTEEEINAAYDRLSDQLIQPEAMMLDVYNFPGGETKDLAKAKSTLRKEAEDAESFLVEKGFNHLTAGIPEAWFTASQVPASVWPQVLEMKSGDVDSFPDAGGLLLIRKLDQRDARPMTLDEARGIVTDQLLRERQERLWNTYVEETRQTVQP